MKTLITKTLAVPAKGYELRTIAAIALLVAMGLGSSARAQETAALANGSSEAVQSRSTVVPQLMRYSGVATNRSGETVEAVFSIYGSREGGEAIWSETQRVSASVDGKYNVLLGAASVGGLPQTVFAGGQARWLGVSIERGEEQPRSVLASVAYAMKAADSETLAGQAAANYVTQAQLEATAQSLAAQAIQKVLPESAPSGSGTANSLPLWTSLSALADSALYQSGAGAAAMVGIGTTTPATTLDVLGAATIQGQVTVPSQGIATAALGTSSWPVRLTGSTYDSTSGAPVLQSFSWQVAPFQNDTALAQGYLSLNYAAGANAPKQILAINNLGQIAFAPGQDFPGLVSASAPNTFTNTQTIIGGLTGLNATATSETGTAVNASGGQYGVFSRATRPTGVGVFGSGNWAGVEAAGQGYGLYATASNLDGSGVQASGGRLGVYGVATATSGSTVGVFGSGADGVQGSGTVNGVYGASTAKSGIGVNGVAPAFGVYGIGPASWKWIWWFIAERGWWATNSTSTQEGAVMRLSASRIRSINRSIARVQSSAWSVPVRNPDRTLSNPTLAFP